MTKYRGQKGLYEAITQSRSKSRLGKVLEPLRPRKTPTKPPPAAPAGDSVKVWRRRRMLLVNQGRIEVSLSYELAIALLLGLVLVILVVFAVGHRAGSRSAAASVSGGSAGAPTQASQTADVLSQAQGQPDRSGAQAGPTATAGDHVIVLVEYKRLADLEPVRVHFARYGITTQILLTKRGTYYLVTRNRYKYTNEKDGSVAIQKIAQVGAMYKGQAPVGRETFASHYFSDAYFIAVDKLIGELANVN